MVIPFRKIFIKIKDNVAEYILVLNKTAIINILLKISGIILATN